MFPIILYLPNNVIGNSNSNNSDNKKDNFLFVRKPYLRKNCIEDNIEEDIELKRQCRNKTLPDPVIIREAASKNYVDNRYNGPSIIKNTVNYHC